MVAAPVSDETALPSTGRYDVKLEWTPQLTPVGGAPGAETEVSIFTAVREQLGLRLETTKAKVGVFVIDRVDMPSAN